MVQWFNLLAVVWVLSAAMAFKCDADELSRYDFGKIKGDYSVSVSKETPPSNTETTWNIGICDTIKSVEECKGAELCGLTKITLDLKTYVTEVIKLDASKAKVNYKPMKDDESGGKSKGSKGIIMTYDDFKWGDQSITAELKFECPSKSNEDEDEDKLVLDKWQDQTLKLRMKTKSACISKKDGKKPSKHDNSDNTGESWGWFTWIFIFFVLFLSIYIIGGAWFQYNKGNSIDFQTALKEVIENFIDVVKGLPIFVKEIIEKFTGNSNRGEYSAV